MNNDGGYADVVQCTAEWVFKPIAERRHEFPPVLQGFCALQGHRYQGELMVIGRAGNLDKLPEEPPDGADWEDVASKLATTCMSWVTDKWETSEDGYYTKRSAFWRVIRHVSLRLVEEATDEDWPTHLVWSNLYKVSPPGSKNPGPTLARAQQDGCAELLKLEIRAFRPKRVLFLTGWDWAQELFCAPPDAREPAGEFVDRVWDQSLDPESGLANRRFVVAKHPQGKKEGDWVREVLQQFQ